MNCLEFRQLLDEHLDGALDAVAEAALRGHLHCCAHCARLHEHAIDVQRALRTLPAIEPAAGFAERMLAPVRAARPAVAPRDWIAAGALAACITAAVAIGMWLPQEATPPVAAGGVEPVRLVFHSESALSGVTFELDLPDGVELSGYPGQRRLVWQSDLRAGANLLELPVQPGGKGGVVTATLNLGTEQRRFSVRVVPSHDAAAPASARREPVAAQALSVAAVPREASRHA